MNLIDALQKILSKDEIMSEPNQMAAYKTDASKEPGLMPTVVIKPKSCDAIPHIIKLANETNTPIYPWGAGTGKAGNATHTIPGIVLSFENQTKIINIDKTNKTMTVQPGVTTQAVQEAAKNHGLYFPPDPASLDTCTIGGNVAVNAGGPRAVKYGVTGNYVQQLKGFTMTGEPFCFGGMTKKDVAGYDLKNLLIGSEGTLGIITEITLKLIPHPTHQHLQVLEFKELETAISCLQNLSQQGLTPSMMEFIDKPCIEFGKKTEWSFETLNAINNYIIMLEFDGSSQQEVSAQRDIATQLINQLKPIQQFTDPSHEEETKWWAFRRNISYILSDHSDNKISHDVTVPLSNVAAMMTHIQSLSSSTTKALGYGHLGDGNIHANVLNIGQSPTEWALTKKTATNSLMKKCLELEGTITGEHGIGLSKKEYMPWQFNHTEISLMKAIKRNFDPNNLLNPNKII